MNRLKQELRKKGVMLESDYECLPCDGLETVVVDSEKAIVATYHNFCGWTFTRLNKDGSFTHWHY